MKTATILVAAILVFAPFNVAEAAPPADFEKEIAVLKTQIQLLEIRLAKLEAGEKKVIKEKPQKEKRITIKKNKRMDEKAVVAGSSLPQAVVDLDAKWAEREAELNAKYTVPGKWQLVDEKGIKEHKKYLEKREALLKD